MTHRKHRHFDLQQKYYGEFGRYRCLKHYNGILVEESLPMWIDSNIYELEEIRPLYQLNGVQYPAPETEPLEMGQTYYIGNPWRKRMCDNFSWTRCEHDVFNLTRGLIHLKPESAIQHSTAMLAGKPVEDSNK